MADLTLISQIPEGTELTAGQIRSIINQIQLNIYNIVRENKNNGADYQEHGSAGHSFNGAGQLKELREQLKYWEGLLAEIPAMEVTIYDDPNI